MRVEITRSALGKATQISPKIQEERGLADSAPRGGVEQAHFPRIHLEFRPMAGFHAVSSLAAPGNNAVRPGLKMEVDRCARRLDQIHDRRKGVGRCLGDLDVFRPKTEHDGLPGKFLRARKVREREAQFYRALFRL